MKAEVKLLSLLLLLTAIIPLTQAEVEVYNYDIETKYDIYDILTGFVNLSFEDIPVNANIRSNRGNSMPLVQFLEANSALYTCSTPGCAKGYEISSPSTTKTINLQNQETKHTGFKLEGRDILITGITFNLQSDFQRELTTPITIELFGKQNWSFNKFSEEYSQRNYGCYNPTIGVPGPKLRNAKYCELINIQETGAVFAGTEVEGQDTALLQMVIHPGTGGDELASCNYDPNNELGCPLTRGGGLVFETGSYQVCVEENSFTNYSILSETNGNSCGFAYEFGPGTGNRDYAIFAQTARYESSSYFNQTLLDFQTMATDADTYINQEYSRDCQEGCILPITLTGVEQEVTIGNIQVDYKAQGVAFTEDEFYTLEPEEVNIAYEGELDVRYTGFNISEGGSYSLYLDQENLFTITLDPIETPEVTSLYPTTVPAGVPVEITANTGTASGTLRYQWNFGDNSTSQVTNTNTVTHTFPEINSYPVSVSVASESTTTAKKTFTIQAISPKQAINETLTEKQKAIKRILQIINTAPNWYKTKLEEITKATFYQGEITRLRSASETFTNNTNLIEIAQEVYQLETPTELAFDIEPTIELLNKASLIEPAAVANIEFNGNTREAAKYADSMIQWQYANIIATINSRLYKPVYATGEETETLRGYSATIHSFLGEEGYLVLDAKKEDITFNGAINAIESGTHTLIPLQGSQPQTFEFYVISPTPIQFFTSPKLENILLPGEIGVDCNNNFVCEKELGENPRTCRNDCKPVVGATIYIILAILLTLTLYTLLQLWYKRNYETYLFTDRTHLYNLLMFIANARAREQTDKEIISQLGSQGWSHERLIYAMKKSRGERTGMLELIPIEKLFSYLRNKKAKKQVQNNQQIRAPPTPGTKPPTRTQPYGNINKQRGFGTFGVRK